MNEQGVRAAKTEEREGDRQAQAYANWLGIRNRAERRAFKKSFAKGGRGYTKSPKVPREEKKK